jgi:hypothetical protein
MSLGVMYDLSLYSSRQAVLHLLSAGVAAIVKTTLAPTMTSPDFTYERADLTIWTLAEPAASIMAISIPVL